MAPLTQPYAPDTPVEVTTDAGEVRAVPDGMSVAEFESFPWPDEQHWELINGVPIMSPSPRYIHQHFMAVLIVFLHGRLPNVRLVAEFDQRVPGNNYFRPDVMVLPADVARDLDAVPNEGVPALVVEILSESSKAIDFGPKRDTYAAAGIGEYWVVNPRTGALSVYVADESGAYEEAGADEEGYVRSPLIDAHLRIRPRADTFDIDVR